MVIWLVGLSGSGKTTIGKDLYQFWKKKAPNTVMVDGDDIRRIMGHDANKSDYTVEGRLVNAKRIVEICSWLDRQNINVVCCILCIFDEIMINNRKTFSKYFQVYINTPMNVLIARDTKGIYKRAMAGNEKNVVGWDMEFKEPTFSDMLVDTSPGAPTSEQIAFRIIDKAGLT